MRTRFQIAEKLGNGEKTVKNRFVNQAVILAGGYGTRLRPFTDTSPKPMYPFEGKPFLEYLIEQVKSFGIEEIVLLLGYLPEVIMDYFGGGEKWGVQITYSVTPVEYETGLRLLNAKDLIQDAFLLMYCDNYCPIDFEILKQLYCESDALLLFTAYRNRDQYTKSNLKVGVDGRVEVYDKKRVTPGLQGVDIGYAIVNKKVFDYLPQNNHNFEAVLYPLLVKEQKLFAVFTEHRYYSVGSWERIELTKRFFSNQKYIFLDRDGTLNVRPPKACYVEKPEDFVWLPGAKEAIKKLNEAGFKVLLVSNQPGLARGRLTEEMLFSIHTKMQEELHEIGAEIERIYYCPHNWDEGCDCRKPKPGMFYQAQKEYSLNLRKCLMIGDDERDIKAGQAAGCRSILVSEDYPLSLAVEQLLDEKGEEYIW